MTASANASGTLDRVAANLRSLAHDLDEIASGSRPTAAELDQAPLLDIWEPKLTVTHAPAIRGRVYGHPLIADGETLRADILAADPDLTWVMSWAGFYRLGRQAEMTPPTAAVEGARA